MIACEIIIMSYITRRFLLKLFKKRDGYLSTMPSMKDCHSSHNLNLSQNPIITTISEAVPELPFDIITEILSWLPVESLLRFKCVCKKWSSLIKDDYKFIVRHMDRASSLQLSYQHVWEPNERSPIRYDEKFIYLSDVAGLFLEESLTSRVFRIRNYATQQVLYLPDAHEGTKTMGFAFNSSTGECKVACFYAKEGDFGREVGFKILSIGKDDQWRTLMLPNQNHKSCHRQYRCATSQYDGAAHLIEIIRDGQDCKLEVQSFDLWSECFTITTLPRRDFLDLKKVSVIPWNQTVAVADRVEEALQVLVLEDFKEHNWNKIIVPLKFLKDDPVLKKKIRPKLAWSDELRFHNAEKNTSFVYDMKRGVIKETHTKSTEKKYFFHKPSLVTLKGMKNEY